MRLFAKNKNGYIKAVGGLVALLIVIIVGIMIFWQTTDSMPAQESSRTEIFTGYTLPDGSDSSGGSNDTAQTVTLAYVPYSTTNASITVYCYNSSAETQTAPPVTIANRAVTIQSGSGTANPAGYSQINVTYTPKIYIDSATTKTQATTTFNLLPIIAIVIVGSILIGLVIGFGGKKEV